MAKNSLQGCVQAGLRGGWKVCKHLAWLVAVAELEEGEVGKRCGGGEGKNRLAVWEDENTQGFPPTKRLVIHKRPRNKILTNKIRIGQCRGDLQKKISICIRPLCKAAFADLISINCANRVKAPVLTGVTFPSLSSGSKVWEDLSSSLGF